jgi:hypothetical protein
MHLLFLLFIIIFIIESIEDFFYKEINLILHIINILISFFLWKIIHIYFLLLIIYFLFFPILMKHIGGGDLLYIIIYFFTFHQINFIYKFYILLFFILIEYIILYINKKDSNKLITLPLIPAIFISFICCYF